MPYLTEFITVAVIHLLAVMSPGPDFAVISKNSLVYSRKTGIFTAVGLGLGIVVHVTYSLIGIGLLISKSILLFSIIKYLGAAYLIYIGYKALRSRKSTTITNPTENKKDISGLQAIKNGFLTNTLNPKATLFFLSLFTQVISPETPTLIQLLYGAEMVAMTIAWFSLVAVALSHALVKKSASLAMHYIERIFGAILILLGVKIALTTSK